MAQGFWNPQGSVRPLNNSAPVGGQPSTTGAPTGAGSNPPAGMGYAGFSPVQLPQPTLGPNQASPVQLPWQTQQGQQDQARSNGGGVLGAMTPRPMSQRETQMLARYLPGSGAGVDPLASRGSVAQAGGWQNFARNHYGSTVGGMFDQFMQQNPGMNSYQDAVNNPVVGAMIRARQRGGGGSSPGMTAMGGGQPQVGPGAASPQTWFNGFGPQGVGQAAPAAPGGAITPGAIAGSRRTSGY